MQTPSFSSSRILLPVRRWFVALTLLGALLLNFLPNVPWLWMPDWVALVVIFWGIREPRLVGMGWAFLLGLAMDVADASVLGQHALAYVLADPNVASAVVGATRMAHLLENLAASGMALDADTCDRIRAVQEDAR